MTDPVWIDEAAEAITPIWVKIDMDWRVKAHEMVRAILEVQAKHTPEPLEAGDVWHEEYKGPRPSAPLGMVWRWLGRRVDPAAPDRKGNDIWQLVVDDPQPTVKPVETILTINRRTGEVRFPGLDAETVDAIATLGGHRLMVCQIREALQGIGEFERLNSNFALRVSQIVGFDR